MKLTEQNLQNLVSYWAGKLYLPLPLFRKDNRISDSAAVYYCEDCSYFTFRYNFKIIKTLADDMIIGLIFHELGHIKYKHRLESIKSEYQAERYALQCVKKYYPDYLKLMIKNMKKQLEDKDWKKDNPTHDKAFSMIKEYKRKPKCR